MITENEIEKMLANVVLKEERGVSASKYKSVFNEIIEYCYEMIKNTPKFPHDGGYDYIFTIPEEITSKIDFIEKLTLKIFLKDIDGKLVYSGGGKTHIETNHITSVGKDGKFPPVQIDLFGYYTKWGINSKTISGSFYHELNHCYDIWKRKGITNKQKIINDISVKDNAKKVDFSLNQDVNKYFQQLFYRLFIPTELNALASSVYGDLQTMNSEECNFSKDINETSSAKLLIYFSNNLDIAIENANIELLMKFCKENNICSVPEDNSIGFIGIFKREVEKHIRKTWKIIGRAASLWYDNISDKKLNEQEYINISYHEPIDLEMFKIDNALWGSLLN